jgi:hypothetical protein
VKFAWFSVVEDGLMDLGVVELWCVGGGMVVCLACWEDCADGLR